MKIRVITDTHLFGITQVMNYDEVAKAIYESPYPVAMLGDIVDLANCKYSDLPQAYQQQTLLYALAKKYGHAVRGNHDLNKVNAPDEDYIDPENRVLIAHSDYACWGKERADEFRNQQAGAGFIHRTFISRPINFLRHLREVRPNQSEKAWIASKQFDNKGLRVCLFGHNHPGKVFLYSIAGINIGIFPQGITDIEITQDYEIKVL